MRSRNRRRLSSTNGDGSSNCTCNSTNNGTTYTINGTSYANGTYSNATYSNTTQTGNGTYSGNGTCYCDNNGNSSNNGSINSNTTDNSTISNQCPSCCTPTNITTLQNYTPPSCNVTVLKTSCITTVTGRFTSPSCYYKQVPELIPSVTTVSNNESNKIVFNGTDFFVDGYTVHATYSGIPADSVVVDGA